MNKEVLSKNISFKFYFFHLLTDLKRETAEKELQDIRIASKTREEELELEVNRLKEQAEKSDRERIKIRSELDQKLSKREKELELEVNRLKKQAEISEQERDRLRSELDQKISDREEELELELNRLKKQAEISERERNKLRSELDHKLSEMMKTKDKSDKEKFQLAEEMKLMKIEMESSETEVEKKSKEIIRLQQDLEKVKCDKLRLVLKRHLSSVANLCIKASFINQESN
jgi:hypothetical protein